MQSTASWLCPDHFGAIFSPSVGDWPDHHGWPSLHVYFVFFFFCQALFFRGHYCVAWDLTEQADKVTLRYVI